MPVSLREQAHMITCSVTIYFEGDWLPVEDMESQEATARIQTALSFAAFEAAKNGVGGEFRGGTYQRQGGVQVRIKRLKLNRDSAECLVVGGHTEDAEDIVRMALEKLGGQEWNQIEKYVTHREYSTTTTHECSFRLEDLLAQHFRQGFLQHVPSIRRFAVGQGAMFDPASNSAEGKGWEMAPEVRLVTDRINFWVLLNSKESGRRRVYRLRFDYMSTDDAFARRLTIQSDMSYQRHKELVDAMAKALATNPELRASA